MNDKDLRLKLEKIRAATNVIIDETNEIYNEVSLLIDERESFKKKIFDKLEIVEQNLIKRIQDPYYDGVVSDEFQDVYDLFKVKK